MKYYDWDELKNEQLKNERHVCFEDVLRAIDDDRILGNVAHPNQRRYPGQRILVVEIEEYVFVVPFIEDDEKIFLKTIYPSRKFTRKYIVSRRQS